MATRKKTKRTKSQIQEIQMANYVESSPTTPSLKIKRSYLITGIVIFVVIGFLVLLRSLIVVAFVNGQTIFRYQVIQELEKQGGKQVFNGLVTKSLVLQEAQKKNITVTQKEIDLELKKVSDNVSSQGQNLDQLLQMQGMSKKDLEDQIRVQKLIEKLVPQSKEVTDKETQDYYEKNKSSYPEGTTYEQLKDTIKTQLNQEKQSKAYQDLLQKLQNEAKITYFLSY